MSSQRCPHEGCETILLQKEERVNGLGLVTLLRTVPYSRKYWRSIKFGGLAVEEATVKFKSVKFKCARDLRDIRIILRVRVRTYYMYGTTAKFKDHQYFRLYGIFFLK